MEIQKIQIRIPEVCLRFSISEKTVYNWIRLGKLIPDGKDEQGVFFLEETLKERTEVIEASESVLKSRRNKQFADGNRYDRSYVSGNCQGKNQVRSLVEQLEWQGIFSEDSLLSVLLADWAVKMLLDQRNSPWEEEDPVLLKFLEGRISFGDRDILIEQLLPEKEKARLLIRTYADLMTAKILYEPGEDVLGLLYLSCLNMGSRQKKGAYYTPTKVVRSAVAYINGEGRILDPACGTGNFLLQIPGEAMEDRIYGMDLDPCSVKIARINMALRFPETKTEVICDQIRCGDFLDVQGEVFAGRSFAWMIGNPPWGSSLSREELERYREIYHTAKGKRVDTADLFVERAFQRLQGDGNLLMVLPEALLFVQGHKAVREILMEKGTMVLLSGLGEVFDGVNCPSILLWMKKSRPFTTAGMRVKTPEKEFIRKQEWEVTPERFAFFRTDEEELLLEKIRNGGPRAYLKKQAKFALGIVTGANKELLSEVPEEGAEPVYRGRDIFPFRIAEPKVWLCFTPDKFQQCAPEEIFRAKEKLFYRFIGKELVFALDDRQRISLNSCNILIPKIEGLKIRYLLAVLNSSVARYYFREEFRSVKVLKNHLEALPIPVPDAETQEEIVTLVTDLLEETEETKRSKSIAGIDDRIRQVYGISEEEFRIIQKSDGNKEK